MKKSFRAIISIVVLAAALLLGVALGSRFLGSYEREVSSESTSTKLGFEDLGELVTQGAYCTEVNVTESNGELFGVKLPFSQSKYIYSYDIEVKAGIDFGEVEIAALGTDEVSGKTEIEVRLPEAKVLSCELKMDSFKVYFEKASIFNPITLEENNDAMSQLKKTAEETAVANGLLDNALSNAEVILKGFLDKSYDPALYDIIFTVK